MDRRYLMKDEERYELPEDNDWLLEAATALFCVFGLIVIAITAAVVWWPL